MAALLLLSLAAVAAAKPHSFGPGAHNGGFVEELLPAGPAAGRQPHILFLLIDVRDPNAIAIITIWVFLPRCPRAQCARPSPAALASLHGRGRRITAGPTRAGTGRPTTGTCRPPCWTTWWQPASSSTATTPTNTAGAPSTRTSTASAAAAGWPAGWHIVTRTSRRSHCSPGYWHGLHRCTVRPGRRCRAAGIANGETVILLTSPLHPC